MLQHLNPTFYPKSKWSNFPIYVNRLEMLIYIGRNFIKSVKSGQQVRAMSLGNPFLVTSSQRAAVSSTSNLMFIGPAALGEALDIRNNATCHAMPRHGLARKNKSHSRFPPRGPGETKLIYVSPTGPRETKGIYVSPHRGQVETKATTFPASSRKHPRFSAKPARNPARRPTN